MSQLGYGQNDPVGSPFEVIAPVAGQAITAVNNALILTNPASVASVAVTLPLNPPDGCEFTLMSIAGTTTSTVAANTGDTLVSVPAGLGAVTTFTANTTFVWVYSLTGNVLPPAAAPVNARTWIRIK
jgi:hypothetical protein